MKIVGRGREIDILNQCMDSGRPEFIAVYGRRRIGKTFLIKEFFRNHFSFYVTGVPEAKTNRQRLAVFHIALKEYGCPDRKAPDDWLEAFSRLKILLDANNVQRDFASNRRVIFIDELPWLDSPRSDFKMALDWFWNSWASAQEDVCLIVCGSATSWIIKNILFDTGGLYNRITRQIYLRPFTMAECEEFLQNIGVNLPRQQIIEAYMILGGVPYYLNYYDRRLSFAQNIQAIIFDPSSPLHYEHQKLFQALFAHSDNHWKVVEVLAGHKAGLLRSFISLETGLDNGRVLTQVLQELEECGFIRKYSNFTKKTREAVYQLIDPYTLFYLTFLKNQKVQQWMQFISSPAHASWAGHAFEMVCLHHLPQIRQKLGISGIQTQEFAWAAAGEGELAGAQIDLLIDRADNTISICEMKYTENAFIVSQEYRSNLLNKKNLFREKTKTKKALMLVMISASGVSKSAYWDVLQNIVTGDDLFVSL